MQITKITVFFFILVFILEIQAAQLQLSSFDGAFVYSGEKIVYISIGSASDKDTYQLFPLFMQKLYEKYPGICKCISADGLWSLSSIKNIEILLKKRLQKIPSHLFIVNNYIKEENIPALTTYCKRVMENGGVIFLGIFTGPNLAPFVPVMYNNLINEGYGAKILFFSTTTSWTTYWWNREIYSLYDDLMLIYRLKAKKILKNQARKSYADYFKSEELVYSDSRSTILDKFIVFHNMNNDTYDKSLQAKQPSNEKLLLDLLEKPVQGNILAQNTSTILFDAKKVNDSFHIEKPYLPQFNLFDKSKEEIVLQELSQNLNLLRIFITH